jgi:hypothetical protein
MGDKAVEVPTCGMKRCLKPEHFSTMPKYSLRFDWRIHTNRHIGLVAALAMVACLWR